MKRGKGPVVLKARGLERFQAPGPSANPLPFTLPDDAPAPPAACLPGGAERQALLAEAIAAAQNAGLLRYRVNLAPDGSVAIVVGPDADTTG
jgi:hypothetical protein